MTPHVHAISVSFDIKFPSISNSPLPWILNLQESRNVCFSHLILTNFSQPFGVHTTPKERVNNCDGVYATKCTILLKPTLFYAFRITTTYSIFSKCNNILQRHANFPISDDLQDVRDKFFNGHT